MNQKKKDEGTEILEQAQPVLEACRSRIELIEQANRVSKALTNAAATQKQFTALDSMVAQRMSELITIHKHLQARPEPKIENGVYMAPTPRIGERVIWCQGNDPSRIMAADVVLIEQPGQVQLRLVKAKGDALATGDHVQGVRHASDPIHDKQGNPHTVRSGSWDYLPGEKIPDSHYEEARKLFERRAENARKSVLAKMEQEKAIAEQRELAKKLEPEPV